MVQQEAEVIAQARLSVQAQNWPQAVSLFQQALALNRQSDLAWRGLADCFYALMQMDKAIPCLQQACQHAPSADNLLRLCEFFNQIGHASDGLKVLEFGFKREPHNPILAYHLCRQLAGFGRHKDALQYLTPCFAQSEPRFVAYCYLEWVRIAKGDERYQKLNDMLIIFKQSELDPHTRMVLAYALGSVYDAIGDYHQAATYFLKANQLQLTECGFQTSDMDTLFTEIKQIYTDPASLPKSDHKHEIVPVFIVGMPRTGSTLLEQMLIQHEQIDSLSEVNYLAHPAISSIEHASQQPFPNCIQSADQASLDAAVQQYWHCADQHGLKGRYWINKLPANFQNIGAIMQLFNNAKIIDIRRNPGAVGLSVFKHYFAQNEPYFCSLSEFSEYFDAYDALMKHWQAHFSQNIFKVDYEQLVAQPESTLKRIMAFLGCDYEPRCLQFNQSSDYVSTLSANQVKQPLQKSNADNLSAYQDIFEQLTLLGAKS